MLVKDLGLDQGNSVQTSATHGVIEEEPEPLDQGQHSKYRSQVARCWFLSQDRVASMSAGTAVFSSIVCVSVERNCVVVQGSEL